MDIDEVRLHNLRALLAECGNNQSELARRIDSEAAYVNQLLRGWKGKHVGPKFARKAEAAMGKPRGWMDQDHSRKSAPATPVALPPGLTEMSVRVARKWQALNEPARTQVLMLIETLGALESSSYRRWATKQADAMHRLYEKNSGTAEG